jgi:hypothetical protein
MCAAGAKRNALSALRAALVRKEFYAIERAPMTPLVVIQRSFVSANFFVMRAVFVAGITATEFAHFRSLESIYSLETFIYFGFSASCSDSTPEIP